MKKACPTSIKPKRKPQLCQLIPPSLVTLLLNKVNFSVPDTCSREGFWWKSAKRWGTYLRVYGTLMPSGLKGMIIQIKWKASGGSLIPAYGFETVSEPLDLAESMQIQDVMIKRLETINSFNNDEAPKNS
jgi:hypothetical protein